VILKSATPVFPVVAVPVIVTENPVDNPFLYSSNVYDLPDPGATSSSMYQSFKYPLAGII